ncbi:DUF5084 family protein [Staphylococcus lugdunensis]|uniref:DUF5084 family protein n=1 Tax=Staphylococcus lugdunensis TaxID=28035 RepID=UPI000459463B|nr:DUF5084 family protein [Staphylococcus lugdunensis]KAK57052.1 putative membrane protein [Staphylococcus lugdunensis VCU150]MCI2844436.1 DUF5084 family protein [Staphylococcus lugdunensis]
MIKTIKVTSLIGLILEGFLSLIFALFFATSISGLSQSEIQTTVNGETTMQSAETSSLIYNWIFGVLMVVSIISFIIGIIALKIMTKKTTMSAVLYIIGGFVSLNLIAIFAWTFCGILLLKNKEALKRIVIEKNKIGNAWWIILAIAGVLGLLSVYGFVIGIGALGILAMNIAWLTVYTPKKNSQIFENTAKPTMYASIIGVFIMSVLMNILDYVAFGDGKSDIGIKLYGNTFNIINMPMLILSLILFAIGTYFVFQIQLNRLKS